MSHYPVLSALLVAGALLAVSPGAARADEVTTGLLKSEEGFVGDELGAEITDLDLLDDGPMRLKLTLPALAIDPERVEVIDGDGRPLRQVRKAKIEADYDNDRVGVVLYLNRNPNVEFRVRLHGEPREDVEPKRE